MGTIGDEVWFDVNADGTQQIAGEPGIAGVTVALALDANNNGVIDAGEIIATDTTDSATGTISSRACLRANIWSQ